ncbi:uncharacterized protein G2W53_037143 [Senna tora]|uniref:Uncharacterized protein n=1 Tax=Senna tora TaxID=362788 RepID=A0A834SU68_9FABA|nr:uncharacterized protein G2W53_037143 [Senna tora]
MKIQIDGLKQNTDIYIYINTILCKMEEMKYRYRNKNGSDGQLLCLFNKANQYTPSNPGIYREERNNVASNMLPGFKFSARVLPSPTCTTGGSAAARTVGSHHRDYQHRLLPAVSSLVVADDRSFFARDFSPSSALFRDCFCLFLLGSLPRLLVLSSLQGVKNILQ